METNTALVTIEPTTALSVFTDTEKVDPIIAAIRKIVAEFTPDTTTAKGRKEIASIAHKVAQSKTYLDGIGKRLTDEYKDIPKKIDANRKRIRDELDALKDEVRRPLTEWEEAEKARVQGIKDRIGHIKCPIPDDSSSEGIAHAIKTIESELEIDDTFAEFKAEAQAAKDATLARLYSMRDAATKREAEAAELKRLREEAAKREAEDRDRRIAEEAAAKARRDAEEAAARAAAEVERKAKAEREAAERRELELKLAAEKAERERLEGIKRAEMEKQAAIEAERKKAEDAERDRIAELARIQAESYRRAADAANRERIHADIVDYLIAGGCPDGNARNVVILLAAGAPHVTIKY